MHNGEGMHGLFQDENTKVLMLVDSWRVDNRGKMDAKVVDVLNGLDG